MRAVALDCMFLFPSGINLFVTIMNNIKISMSLMMALTISFFTISCSDTQTVGTSMTVGKTTLVNNPSEFEKALQQVQPGSVITLANGVWKDFEIVLDAEGTQSAPITLNAQDKGKVILSGKSSLKLGGEYLVVSGLVFKDGYSPTGEVISFRVNDQRLANHSRVTEVVIDNYNNPERFETDFWVLMYGKHNRFDHNHIEGKRNVGVTMAVRLNTKESQENYHRIDHNYFGPRPILGSNGGETLRIGTSHYSLNNSFTVVENNYFDRCNGELEIISNKSGSNKIIGNVFYQSRGTLTLRHGNDNVVKDNVFFGGSEDHTGGIRLINARQTITNNYIEGLAGYRFGGGLVVMNGVPNSSINRYHQVKDSYIENNSLVNVEHIQLAAGADSERSATPLNTTFKANLITNDDHHDAFTVYDDVSGLQFSKNILNNVKKPKLSNGFTSKAFELERASNGLMYPVGEGFDNVGVSKTLSPIRKEAVGVSWYPKRDKKIAFDSGRIITVKPLKNALVEAVQMAKAGDIIELSPGEYVVTKILTIDKPLTVRAASTNGSQSNSALSHVSLAFERSTLFSLVDGGSLKIKDLTITGAQAPDNAGNAIVRTQRRAMLNNYELIIEGASFVNMNVNHSFNVLSTAKGTMADTIEITRSSFKDITGAILKLDAENDNYGIYNAEYVTIRDSHFERVQGAVVEYYRGGTDESTFGPHFSMTNSTLSEVGFGKKNWLKSSVLLHGVQVSMLKGNSFTNSRPIIVNHTVGEPVTQIINNVFTATELPNVVELNSGLDNTAMIKNNVSKPGLMLLKGKK